MSLQARLSVLEENARLAYPETQGRYPATMILSNESPDTALVIFSDGSVENVTHAQAEAMRSDGKTGMVVMSAVNDHCADEVKRLCQGERLQVISTVSDHCAKGVVSVLQGTRTETRGQLRGSTDGGVSGGYIALPPEDNAPTLAELGLTKRALQGEKPR
jgi:hypothetical protein